MKQPNEMQPMTLQQLVPIWTAVQRAKAKMAILKADRVKTSLTYKEQMNKYAQLGNYITNERKNAVFTFEMGMGLLITKSQRILGASIDDLINYKGE